MEIKKLSFPIGGRAWIGGGRPVLVQTMCNTSTDDIAASVAQCRAMAAAGADLIRLTTQGLKQVESLREIKAQLRAEGILTPLVADIHFLADAALAAATVADKVRINPGNFAKEHEVACAKFRELIALCRQNGTAIRIGLNHGSLGERITQRYGATPLAMKEAVMEWLRMCRGHRLMKRLMKGFSQEDAYSWFECHGVRLTTQEDQCVFPMSQDSHTIINCFLAEARKHHIEIRTETKIDSLEQLSDYDFIAVTTGGSPKGEGLRWLGDLGHEIAAPVPSLFTFQIADEALHALMGTVVEDVVTMIPGTKLRAEGPLLITHWGMSGPAILKLSSYGAAIMHFIKL